MKTTLSSMVPDDSGVKTFLPVTQMESEDFNPADIAASQTMSEQALTTITGQGGDLGGGFVPLEGLEDDLLPVTQFFQKTDSLDPKICLHSIAAVNGSARKWKRLVLPGLGRPYSLTWDPPNTIAAQTAYAADSSTVLPSGQDYLLFGTCTPDATWNGQAVRLPPVARDVSGTVKIRLALHTLATGSPTLDSSTFNIYAVANPERYYRVLTVSVNPPDLAANTAVKVRVGLPEGAAKLGDFVAAIPPLALHVDLIFVGCYLEFNPYPFVSLGLHSVSAINDSARDWKFVIIPEGTTLL